MADKRRDKVVSPKAFIRAVVDSMPDTASFADLIDEIRLAVALEESQQDYRAGRVSSQEDVKERMRRRFGGKS